MTARLLFCTDDGLIFDSFLPLSTRGSIAALGLSSLAHAKRLVKQTPALAQMAHRAARRAAPLILVLVLTAQARS